MSHTIVTYTVKPGREQENAALVRAVFEELAQSQPSGFRYAVFQAADSRESYTCTPMRAPYPARCNSCPRFKPSWPGPLIATSNQRRSNSSN